MKMAKKSRIKLLVFNLLILLAGILLVAGIDRGTDIDFEANTLYLETTWKDGQAAAFQSSYTDFSAKGDSISILTPPFEMKRGIYTVSVDYECQGNGSTSDVLAQSYGIYNRMAQYVKSDQNRLKSGRHTVNYHVYTSYKCEEIQIRNTFNKEASKEGDYLSVKHVSIQYSPLSYIRDIGLLLLLLILADVLIWTVKTHIYEQTKLTGLCLTAIILISSYPLFVNYLLSGHDLEFHLMRIEGLKCGLESGMFPVRIQPLWLDGHGYAVSIFYSDLFLYIPVLLRFLGLPVFQAYKAYIFIINGATAIIAYYSFKILSGSRKAGIAASCFYTLFPYRLVNNYIRAALGEYTAMTFLPLVLCGFYEVYTKTKENKPSLRGCFMIILGLTGIIQSHVLTCEMIAVFIIAICAVLFRRTFSRDIFLRLAGSATVTVVLNLWYLIPFLDYYRLKFNVNDAGHIHWMEGIQQNALYPAQLLTTVYSGTGSSTGLWNGMKGEMPFGIGLASFIIIFLFLAGIVTRKEGFREKKNILCFACCCTSLFLTTYLFPYDFIRILAGNLESLIINLQFPWRFLSMAGIFLTWLTVIVICQGEKHVGGFRLKCFISALCLFICYQSLCQMNEKLNADSPRWIYDTGGLNTNFIMGEEYLPQGTDKNLLVDGVVSTSSDLKVQINRSGGKLNAQVHSESDRQEYVMIPLLYYGGYVAEDTEHHSIKVSKGENNCISLEIPPYYEGTIKVWFRESVLWRCSEWISLAAWAGFVIVWMRKFRPLSHC